MATLALKMMELLLAVGLLTMSSLVNVATALNVSMQQSPPPTLRIDLFHKFQPSSPLRPPNVTDTHLLHTLLQEDSARADAITRFAHLHLNTTGPSGMNLAAFDNGNTKPKPTFTEFVGISGLQYLVTLRLGSSQGKIQEVALVMDITSDLTWLQCQPCTHCLHQKDDPIYDPFESYSFARAPCRSLYCQMLPAPIRTCARNTNVCGYNIEYKDGSQIQGMLAVETVTFGTWEQPGVIFGCNQVTRTGALNGAAGVFALGTGALSFPSVFANTFGNVFSYCLPGFFSHTPGYLTFGGNLMGMKTMNIIRSSIMPSQYFVPLRNIYINGSLVSLPDDLFDIDPFTKRGGVMLDTSSTVTRLIPRAYNSLGVLIKSALSSAGYTVFSLGMYDYCIHLNGVDLEDARGIPYIEFEFTGGAILPLQLHNLFIENKPNQVMCVAIVNARDSPYSVIGTTQQRGSEWSFDIGLNQIGLLSNQC